MFIAHLMINKHGAHQSQKYYGVVSVLFTENHEKKQHNLIRNSTAYRNKSFNTVQY